MKRLAILDDYQTAALAAADWSQVASQFEITVFDQHLGFDEDRIAAALQPFEVLVAMRERTRFPATLLKRLPNLQLLVTAGMRNYAIDMEQARSQGVDVLGTAMLPYPAAEHALALIFDLTKKISQENVAMHQGQWQTVVGQGLNKKVLGLVGLGRLGERVARVALALEMEVIAWSQNLTAERCAEVGGRLVDKESLFKESDLISIHQVLSDRTRGLVGRDEFALMKPTAYIINTSRGPIIQEDALVEALREKRIAGAGLDVFDQEPLPVDHPLRGLDNAVLTGHTGYVIEELYAQVYGEAVENIVGWLSGNPPRLLNAND